MKDEIQIREMLSRQILKFLRKNVKDGDSPSAIARAMQRDFPDREITKQYIESQFKSPQLIFIIWLKKKYHLNLDWLFEGEEHPEIPMLNL